MLNSPVINLAILLSFTYLLCSIIISSLNEIISSAASTRSNDLQTAFKNLFLDTPAWVTYVKDKIETSPHFTSLQAKADKYPSYVPAKNFAMAVVDSMRDVNGNIDLLTIKHNIVNNTHDLPAPLAKIILSFLDKTGTKVEDLESQLGDFYNTAMDRVSGLYKRKLNVWTFILSFLLAFALNVDTVKIIKDSLGNPQQLQQSADNIAQQVNSGNLTNNGSGTKTDTAKSPSSSAQNADNLKSVNTAVGYRDWPDLRLQWGIGSGGAFFTFILKLLGILLTTVAIQLGAPYWFDTLNKVVNIRGTGKKPGETKNKKGK